VQRGSSHTGVKENAIIFKGLKCLPFIPLWGYITALKELGKKKGKPKMLDMS
jgi:hypothetical protein